MLRAASQVAVDEQRAAPRVGERDGEVRGNKGLAVARAGAAQRHDDGAGGPVRVGEAEAHAAHRLDELHALLARELAAVARLQVRHGPEDRQPQVLGNLLRIAYARVEAVQQHDARHRQPQAPKEAQEQEARRRVLHRLQRHDGLIENADVRDAARLGQSRAFVVLLQRGVEVVGDRHRTAQTRFFDRTRRNAAQLL